VALRKPKSPVPPRLQVPAGNGQFALEYIPEPFSKLSFWYRNKYMLTRDRLGMDIYYWHTRHLYDKSTEALKQADIEFILHVIEEHDQYPTDRVERRNYYRAWKLYGHEIKFVVEEMAKDDKQDQFGEMTDGHPYAYGYARKWFNPNILAETKLLYHGLNYYQFLSLLDVFVSRHTQLRNDYAKANGLDPETGLKLKTKKPKTKKKP
jgi:hypothetical protein